MTENTGYSKSDCINALIAVGAVCFLLGVMFALILVERSDTTPQEQDVFELSELPQHFTDDFEFCEWFIEEAGVDAMCSAMREGNLVSGKYVGACLNFFNGDAIVMGCFNNPEEVEPYKKETPQPEQDNEPRAMKELYEQMVEDYDQFWEDAERRRQESGFYDKLCTKEQDENVLEYINYNKDLNFNNIEVDKNAFSKNAYIWKESYDLNSDCETEAVFCFSSLIGEIEPFVPNDVVWTELDTNNIYMRKSEYERNLECETEEYYCLSPKEGFE